MRNMKKSKRISWPPNVNLCQVRLFLSDESPAQVGLAIQDHLQAKSSWVSQPTGASGDDNLPPGFEGSHPNDLLKNKLFQIPLVKWTRPPRFMLDATWQVVAGEESKEVEVQNQREMRILEAVYPRPSAIPPNPSALTDLEPSLHNKFNIPLIPVTPIEDEDATIEETQTHTIPQNATSSLSQPSHSTTANGNSPDMVAQAASALLSVVSSSNSQVNMIDPELLMKILNDPKLHERVIANHGIDNHVQASRTEIGTPSSMTTTLNGVLYSPNRVGPSSVQPIAKDLSYYKSLIQKHGGDKMEGMAQLNDRQNKNIGISKKMKPCVYFNSPRGCRNGANCPYQHDAYALQSGKRVKLDREIHGE